ncbi:hypothetical protein GO011_07965 [Mycobacterium sp. 20091114027_K0903767]|nr:hypothetical protein [Mycobacterium sp. 20091114027_K0903767]
MVPQYGDAATPNANAGRTLMQENTLLDDLADEVNHTIKLPFDISLVGSQCDEADDYWSSSDKKMVLCYEDVTQSLTIFKGDPNPSQTAYNVAMASFFHELGHMVIDIYDLPATGREEDVADQMAAFWLLAPGDQGTPDPDSAQALKDLAREFHVYATQDGVPDEQRYADEHTLDQARMYNLECWVYGSDPDGNQDILSGGLLPKERADRCNNEYNRLMRAWGTLLSPHLK